MKNSMVLRLSAVILTIFLAVLQSGCGGGSSSSTPAAPAGPTVSGVVSDGYVSGATVAVYSDPGMTVQIGSGATDGSGNFSVSLTVSTVPSTIYIKTTGGTDISTGLPAATMFFAGSYTAGSLNVTPITTQVMKAYQSDPSGGLSQALTTVASNLGITTTDATTDVVTNSNAQSAMYQVISTGDSGGTLPDGSYTVKLIFVERANIGSATITSVNDLNGVLKTWPGVIVSGGLISGLTDDGKTISGAVKGSTVAMAVQNASNNGMAMAGEINYGAASGTFTRTVTGSQATGLFLATFTPSSITAAQTTNLFTALGNVFQGTQYFAEADFVPSTTGSATLAQNPLVGYGQISITTGTLNQAGFSYTNFANNGVTATGVTTPMWSPAGGSAGFLTGSRIYALSQAVTSGSLTPVTLYVLGVVGNRNCIGFVTDAGNRVFKIVRIAMISNTAVAPAFQPSAKYWRYEAMALPGALSFPRANFIPGSATLPVSASACAGGTGPCLAYAHNSVTAPSGPPYGVYADGGGGTSTLALAGGTILQEKVASYSATAMGANDHIQFLTLYESMAMSGTHIFGGTCGSDNCSNMPATNVFFMRKDGTTPPDFKGVVNFVSRGVYTTDYSDVTRYLSRAYSYGTLTIDTAAGTAAFSYTNGAGEYGTGPLSLTKMTDSANSGVFSGLVWFSGSLVSSGGGTPGYIDIFWPVGGKVATYTVSDSATGNIQQVGEAYLTY